MELSSLIKELFTFKVMFGKQLSSKKVTLQINIKEHASIFGVTVAPACKVSVLSN